jgi:hypothetical protein
MAVFRRGLALPAHSPVCSLSMVVAAVAVVASMASPPSFADPPAMCRVVNVDFTPGGIPAGDRPDPRKPSDPLIASPEITPQIVAWLEKPSGEFVHTIYITQQTGRFGLGNRPGRFDFNSGPNWPYGRRITVFPVWAHRNQQTFPQVEFQNYSSDPSDPGFKADNELSHSSSQSSREVHFCRPLDVGEHPQWDAASCASTVYTDKGKLGPSTSGYPPRADVITAAQDSPSVPMYKTMNPFDAVSQATPHLGAAAQISWPIPPDLPTGDYVLFMEVSLEQDFNATYSASRYPSPNVSYGTYGVPYRGQPSVVYKVPFTLAETETKAMTDQYVGYGDPDGAATLHDPDDTITSDTPNSGALRLVMSSKDGDTFRVRVDARPERDITAPAPPGTMVVSEPLSSSATLSFLAPGDDGMIGTVTGYEVRYVAGNAPITDDNFAQANEVTFDGTVVSAGQSQALTIKNLLPETEYTVAVRAFDNCHNISSITSATFTTAARKIGEVDACFIATAAYGSVLANDVEMLRRFRDMLLKRSVLGEIAVETYYTFGPPVAGVVGESDLLRSTARDFLTPLVSRVRGLRW